MKSLRDDGQPMFCPDFIFATIFANITYNAGARNDVRVNLGFASRFAKHFAVAFLGGKHFGACRGMDFQLRAAACIRDGLLL